MAPIPHHPYTPMTHGDAGPNGVPSSPILAGDPTSYVEVAKLVGALLAIILFMFLLWAIIECIRADRDVTRNFLEWRENEHIEDLSPQLGLIVCLYGRMISQGRQHILLSTPFPLAFLHRPVGDPASAREHAPRPVSRRPQPATGVAGPSGVRVSSVSTSTI